MRSKPTEIDDGSGHDWKRVEFVHKWESRKNFRVVENRRRSARVIQHRTLGNTRGVTNQYCLYEYKEEEEEEDE